MLMKTILIVAIVSMIIGVVLLFSDKEIISLILILFGSISFVCYDLLSQADKYEEMINTIEENHNDLNFYLDGNEVSFDSIDIRQYQVSYDATANKVYLTIED